MRHYALVWAAVVALAMTIVATARADEAGDKELYATWATAMDKHLSGWTPHKEKWAEDLGWHEAPMLRGLARGYAWSRDAKWLKPLCEHIDTLFSRLKEEPIEGDPSGKAYPGWGHSITGEALVLEPILEFIELAQTDETMPAEYKAKAAEYLKRIDPVMITKWAEAGRWADTHMDCGTFIEGISLPHNKNAHLGAMLLVAARVTPSQERRADYLDKAARLARRWRKFLKVSGDHYIWHYWDAAGRWDFNEKGSSRHWTSLEHRGYAASDTDFAAAAYDHGLVFDRQDMEMHCRTFLKEIWNGDKENPKYRAMGWFNDKYVDCTVLSGLARFDPTIMELWGKQIREIASGWGGIAAVPAWLLAQRRGITFDRGHAASGEFLKKMLDARPVERKADPATDPIVR
ncbi:MAG: hypothetical protein JXL80_02625 [Planctomycetes bacterium]|nr:hypothetical protein [Planctomycetota bacterium]